MGKTSSAGGYVNLTSSISTVKMVMVKKKQKKNRWLSDGAPMCDFKQDPDKISYIVTIYLVFPRYSLTQASVIL